MSKFLSDKIDFKRLLYLFRSGMFCNLGLRLHEVLGTKAICASDRAGKTGGIGRY